MRTAAAVTTKIWRTCSLLPRREDGSQLIEFAIALPFLVLMFAGAIELGRLFQTYTTLTKSTVVGARYLSSPVIAVDATGYAASDINAAKNLMVCGRAASCDNQTPIVSGFTDANITITPPPNTTGVRYVTVSVSYTYSPKVFNLAGLTGLSGLSLSYTMTPQNTMRYLRDSE
jgi:Flp pilus assembly protein TadG